MRLFGWGLVILFLIFSRMPGHAQPALPTGISKRELFGSVIRSSRWPNKHIFVCWENPSSKDTHDRLLVEQAVQRTWVKAANGGIDIAKIWPRCSPHDLGIHILISDQGARTKALGRYLDGMPNGMILNFTFQHWSKPCQHRLTFCIQAIAAHEFGHALGFTHEQNRADAPPECRNELASGSVGDYNVTKYDPNSIMNYCNRKWNGDGKLSALDKEAVRTFYKN